MTTKSDIDVLLINPGGRGKIYQRLATELTAVEPPVWSGLLATYLQRAGLRVAICDANAEALGPDEVATRVAAIAPGLAAVVVYGHQPSASTQVMPAAGAICSAVKDSAPQIPVALVGGHAAALPERTLLEEDVDYVCSGEGPVALLELAQSILGDRSPADVRGVCAMRNGQALRGDAAPLVSDLNEEMPGCAWDLLPMDRYRAHNWHCFGGKPRTPYAAIYTSLGCPYKCTFCCIQAPFKEGERASGKKSSVNTYRTWRAETVLAQIDQLYRDYGVRNFKVADEMFVLNDRHINGICDGLIERDYGLNLWAYGRVDTITPARAEKMKAAGFNWIALGIEAAGESVRDGVQKGYAQADIYSAVDTLRDAGIYTIGNYIFGLPDDDLGTMQATMDLALDLNCEFANFYSAMAYPGSALYDEALREGWALPESWGGYSQHSVDCLPLPTKHVGAEEVLRFRDEAFQEYFTNARYLAMIDATFGADTVAEIESMTTHRLERAFV